MNTNLTVRKLLTAMLVLAIGLWAEAGLALVEGDQVMQCSMSMHKMQAMSGMSCCPDDGIQAPALSGERPPCCSGSSGPERPLGFVVSSQRTMAQPLDVATAVSGSLPQTAQQFGTWRSADAPRFVKPVLDLKTDLRI
ncbi:MAG: hypothetical protein WAN69_08915 [Candidatus Korobacteraceae bacterium]|jgi:hypothetical protein